MLDKSNVEKKERKARKPRGGAKVDSAAEYALQSDPLASLESSMPEADDLGESVQKGGGGRSRRRGNSAMEKVPRAPKEPKKPKPPKEKKVRRQRGAEEQPEQLTSVEDIVSQDEELHVDPPTRRSRRAIQGTVAATMESDEQEEQVPEKVTRVSRRTARLSRTARTEVAETKSSLFKSDVTSNLNSGKFVIGSLTSNDDDDEEEVSTVAEEPVNSAEQETNSTAIFSIKSEPEPVYDRSRARHEEAPVLIGNSSPAIVDAESVAIASSSDSALADTHSISEAIGVLDEEESILPEPKPRKERQSWEMTEREHPDVSLKLMPFVFKDKNNGVEVRISPDGGSGSPDGARKVFRRLGAAVAEHHRKNSGIYGDGVEVRYEENGSLPVDIFEDGTMMIPIRRVFVNGILEDWDPVNEIKVQRELEFELDTGVSFLLPNHYELEITEVPGVREKYGLRMVGGVQRLNRQTALHPIVVVMTACEDLAYVQRFQGVVRARLVRA